MGKKPQHTPNTHLGEVHWDVDGFFGSLLVVCQEMLEKNKNDRNNHFLDTKRHSPAHLQEFFEEIKLENGCLGLDLFVDTDWHTMSLAVIETTLHYGEEIDDQTFLNLIDDFVEYVRGLPLADPDKREGALWTDEDIERGYCDEANRLHQESMQALGEALQASQQETRENPAGPQLPRTTF